MEAKKTENYIEAIGRRKTAVARVRVTPASKASIAVNDRDLNSYFTTEMHRSIVLDPFNRGKAANKFKITAVVKGGGVASQAEAMRHGISRALIEIDKDLRKRLKKEGFLKRDPRAKERRKFGLKKARKAPQWSKR